MRNGHSAADFDLATFEAFRRYGTYYKRLCDGYLTKNALPWMRDVSAAFYENGNSFGGMDALFKSIEI